MIKKSNTFTFRLSDDVKTALQIVAKREDRTMSMQIERFIKLGLQDYASENPSVLEGNEVVFGSIASKRA
jgi:predicted DNA-binding protein